MGKRFTEEELREALALIKEPEQRNIILEADDPVLWSENVFFDPDLGETPFKVKPMVAPVLRSSKKNRALRVGRQSGKTVHLCVDLCHTAAMFENRVILVFLPEKKQMNRILEVMANLLKNSPVKSSFVMGRKDKRRKKENVESDYDYEIKVSSGSVIRFFFMKNNPDKARGQRGTNIYIDEAEYLPQKAYDVILGVIKVIHQLPCGRPLLPLVLKEHGSGYSVKHVSSRKMDSPKSSTFLLPWRQTDPK
jgi:hypothetical protein